jgi:hypothetical protein
VLKHFSLGSLPRGNGFFQIMTALTARTSRLR